jgi:hypothetical protein
VRVKLEATPTDLYLVPVLELLERRFETALADITPGAHDIGPDLDQHGSFNTLGAAPVPASLSDRSASTRRA